MPPSPAESALAAIAQRYEAALSALHDDDLARAQSLVAEVEALLGVLPPEEQDGALERAARMRARAAFDALVAAVTASRDQVAGTLAHQRVGQRALSAYGGRMPVVGSRVERDG